MNDRLTTVSTTNEKTVTDRDVTAIDKALPLDEQPQEIDLKPVSQQPAPPIPRWQKPLIAIGIGLGMTALVVSTLEYPSQSTAMRPPTSRSSTLANSAANEQAASTTQDRPDLAQTAVKEAKLAIALSQADVAQADINIQTFKHDYDRYQDLSKRGLIERQKLVRAKHIYHFAQRQKSYALHGLKIARAQLAAAEIDAAKVTTVPCSRLSANK
jgi:hypothetical protein